VSFQVQTEVFEGPFDLLLHLILADDVDLYEVRLSEIVDAYLVEVKRMQACDLEIATEFLLIAATLVELKLRRLLPATPGIDLDEELGLWEERDMLLARLLECKTFKDAARVLEDLFALASLSVPRTVGMEDAFVELTPDPLKGITADKLRSAFLRVASAKPKPQVSVAHIHAAKISVTEAMGSLIDRLPHRGPTTFRSLTAKLTERIDVVVHFLAVLELFKQGMIDIDQVDSFGDLTVSWIGLETDRELALSGADAYEG